jgi:hypothetical protein
VIGWDMGAALALGRALGVPPLAMAEFGQLTAWGPASEFRGLGDLCRHSWAHQPTRGGSLTCVLSYRASEANSVRMRVGQLFRSVD